MGLFGSSYHELCQKGIKAFESQDLERASELFMKAAAKDPSHPRAFSWLGMTYGAASSAFWKQGEPARQMEYGEMAVRAFDEAIQREPDAELKAEHCWQKGVALAGLNRLKERDDSWAQADLNVPGFTDRRRQELEKVLEDSMRAQAAADRAGGANPR